MIKGDTVPIVDEPRNFVFGPVWSRRLGMSLGIDPIPEKTCNWNCVYCQLGRTVPLRAERREYVLTHKVLAEAKDVLSNLGPDDLDWVTFVGSGEPLLHTGIGEMIRGVKEFTDLPVAVITNGSLLSRPEVREELLGADAVLPTLDIGSAQLFRRVNRPHPAISFEDHVRGLTAFRQSYSGALLLEVMLMKGLNDSEEILRETAGWVEEIRPNEVHVTLPERPPAEPWVIPADPEGVMRASAILGSVARVLCPGEGVLVLDDPASALERLVAVISRHPLSHDQVMAALVGHPLSNQNEILSNLEACGKAKRIQRHGSAFWVSSLARFPEEEGR